MPTSPSIPDRLLLPFTGTEDTKDPIIIDGGNGAYLHTIDGRQLYDGNSSLWVANLGHQHPEITRGLHDQLNRIAHTSLHGQAHSPSIELSQRLPAFAGLPDYYSFFCDSGSEAVEASLKVTLDYWHRLGENERTHILTLQNSYHGETVGAMSVNGGDEYQSYSQCHPYKTQIVSSAAITERQKHLYRGKQMPLEEALDMYEERIAAIILEPIHGAGGIVPVPENELTAIQQACNRLGCLLIVDEVATGFYRSGSRFQHQEHGLKPDMLLLGKGLSAGYVPFAAVLIHPRIGNQYARSLHREPLMHGHTFSGNPLGCTAALSNIDVLSRAGMQSQIEKIQQTLDESLRSLFNEPCLHIRQSGLFAGIEVFSPELMQQGSRIASETCQSLRRVSILVGSIENTIILAPPYISTPEEIRHCVEQTHEALLILLNSNDSRA